MTEVSNRRIESRNALVEFALAVFDWHQRPDDRTRGRLIEKARTAGATTGIPERFEEFARSLEQGTYGGSETR